FLALAPSLTHLGKRTNNEKALILAETLDRAIEKYLENNKSPSRIVHEHDNRGSHFYLTMYWAEALASQTKDKELKQRFTRLAKELVENEGKINEELLAVQGKPVDLKGYYKPDDELAAKAMRPSMTFNKALDAI
ncbi:MAG: NADP-dependent isocitrate dehydrogenase, partial [Candidatus Thermoplasmatota archaeon]|nr:NADP-dependent isocitrate dehydrogenase [Candidatus Thermoplasmatota archaeon]